MPAANQRVGEYVLQDRIAAGTFGEVWRAHHHVWTDQLVAAKIPTDPQYLRNLQREGYAVHGLQHPNIVRAIGFDPYADPAYLTMEYIPGTSLRPLIKNKSLKVDDAVAVLRQVLAGLGYAHGRNLVHRDIKPENVLIHERAFREGFGTEGVVKVTDFGLGKAATNTAGSIAYSQSSDTPEAKEIAGTLDYMAPEQRSGGTVDPRADLYACGVLLYEMLTGERPAGTDLPSDLNRQVPKYLDEAFRRSYARLDKRFTSADEFLLILTAQQQPIGEQKREKKGGNPATLPCQPLTFPLQHRGIVVFAAFSPDGRRVATASWDKTAQVWNAVTGQPAMLPLRHKDKVCSAAFSPNGRLIVTASYDNTGQVWDAVTGQPLTSPLRHAGGVLFAAFSPDGRWIVTASQDKTSRVWDAVTGQPITPPLRHENFVKAAAFSPDGRRVATASWDKTSRVWDAATGQPTTSSLRHDGWVWSAAFSSDGTKVVTAGEYDDTGRGHGSARVWDAATGQPLTPPLRHSGVVFSAAFSPDGRRVVTASGDGTARIWDATTGQLLMHPLSHRDTVCSAAYSPDGRRLVTASKDHTAQVWDAATGQSLTPGLRHQHTVAFAAFSLDGRRVVTASEDSTARVWDVSPDAHGAEVD